MSNKTNSKLEDALRDLFSRQKKLEELFGSEINSIKKGLELVEQLVKEDEKEESNDDQKDHKKKESPPSEEAKEEKIDVTKKEEVVMGKIER